MESVLPKFVLSGKAAEVYQECLEPIPKDIDSAQLAALALECFDNKFPRKKEGGESQSDDSAQSRRTLLGRFFELCVAETLKRSGVEPFYWQATLTQFPSTRYDMICYNPRAPVVISVKYSVKMRWKEAAYEGVCMQQIFPDAKTYLIMHEQEEATRTNGYIKTNQAPGLHGCYSIGSDEYPKLLKELANKEFSQAEESVFNKKVKAVL